MQVFPFPNVLDDDQKDTLRSFVEPTDKFFTEQNKPAMNDETSKIPDNITKGMAELGAFGLMVPPEYNGLGVNNTQYARLAEIIGAHESRHRYEKENFFDHSFQSYDLICCFVCRDFYGLPSVHWIQGWVQFIQTCFPKTIKHIMRLS